MNIKKKNDPRSEFWDVRRNNKQKKKNHKYVFGLKVNEWMN